MEPAAPLRLEVISRPDYTAPGNPDRWLWYWNTSDNVTSVPANARFDVVPLFNPGGGVIQMQQAALVMGPTSTMANQIDSIVNHHLLSYELRNASASLPGVYAFFARLTSTGLNPSEPFLLAFRNQISVDFFEEAVTDINNAAVLSGDYNDDGLIDAADYVVWRKMLGGNDEYNAWRQNFGTASGGAAGVPEPTAVVLFAFAAQYISAYRRRSPRHESAQKQ
jgi:hypothetical protein